MNWSNLPPLSALRAFAAVARHRSLTRAGETLNVTHAAISQQVRGLERHLGVALIVREGRGIALTDAGRELAASLSEGFQTIANGVENILGEDRLRPVMVTTTPTFAHAWLMPRLSDFNHRHPETSLAIQPTADLVPLGPGGADIAIRHGEGHWPGLDVEPLIRTGIVIVAAPGLVSGNAVTAAGDLLRLPWLQEPGTNELSAWLAAQGIVESGSRTVHEMPGHMVMDGVRRGTGISALPHAFVADDIATGRLILLFDDAPPGQGYFIVTPRVSKRPAVKAFASWLRRMRKADGRDAAGNLIEIKEAPSPRS